MRNWTVAALLGAGVVVAIEARGDDKAKDEHVYEMRTYYAAPEKLDALHARFRDHTLKLFAKHGITNVGYWVPRENPDRKLIYFLSYPNAEARAKSWKDFMADPEWQAAYKKSEVDGRLVSKVESVYLATTDYSPKIELPESTESQPAKKEERVFELRVYTTTAGNLENLNARFRDHTVKLFARHGMTNVAYWVPLKDQKGAENTLIYILAHKSVEAAKASFDAFRNDPEWNAARKASEEKAGGSLTTPDGVQSTFMNATDYSPLQ